MCKALSFRTIGVLIAFLLFMQAMSLSACTQNSYSDYPQEPIDDIPSGTVGEQYIEEESASQENPSTTESAATNSDNLNLATLSEVQESENELFIEKEEGFLRGDSYSGYFNKFGIFTADPRNVEESDTPPVVNTSSGEHLISTLFAGGEIEWYLYPTTGEQYFSVDLAGQWSNLLAAEEVNGAPVDGTNESIEDAITGNGDFSLLGGGSTVLSKTPASLTYGIYHGSKWEEYSYELDEILWVMPDAPDPNIDDRISLYEERTKDGFSRIDVSSASPGIYILNAFCGTSLLNTLIQIA